MNKRAYLAVELVTFLNCSKLASEFEADESGVMGKDGVVGLEGLAGLYCTGYIRYTLTRNDI
jgi:hypothetical protein